MVRAIVAVGLFTALLGGFMLRIVLDPESTGVVFVASDDAASAEERTAPGGGTYAFIATQPDSDEPVTYDPCRPLEVVVNDRLAPSDGEAILLDAITEVQTATGLELRVVGTTDTEPFSDDVPDDGAQTVQVSWSDPDELDDLDGNVAGVGGSAYAGDGDGLWYIGGEVALDAPQLDDLGPEATTGVLMHELAHVLGLDHVDDRGELMHPSSPRTEWGPGDLVGLEQLGAGRCA